MPLKTKPATMPRWATDGSALIDTPPSGNQDTGWLLNERPPASWMNWLLYWIYQWIEFIDAPVATGSGSAIDASSSTTSGSAGLAARAGSGVGIGLVALGAGMAATEATLRTTYNGTAFMAAATGVANTGFIIADGGAWGLVIKGESATLTDILTAKSRTAHVTALTAAVGDSVAAMLQNNSAADAATWGYNQGAGPGVRGDSTSGPGVKGVSTSGPGGAFAGNATRGALNIALQAAPSTPASGDIWFDSTELALRANNGAASLRVAKVVGRFEDTATSQAITTTATTAITAATATFPANTVKAQDTILRMHFYATVTRATAGTFALNIKMGSGPNTGVVNLPSGSSACDIWGYFDLMFHTVGSSAAGYVTPVVFCPASPPTLLMGFATGATDVSWALGLSAAFSTANAGNAVAVHKFYVEVL